jgi:hypothetical protein
MQVNAALLYSLSLNDVGNPQFRAADAATLLVRPLSCPMIAAPALLSDIRILSTQVNKKLRVRLAVSRSGLLLRSIANDNWGERAAALALPDFLTGAFVLCGMAWMLLAMAAYRCIAGDCAAALRC